MNTRRQFLAICIGLTVAPMGNSEQTRVWRSRALGADASISVRGPRSARLEQDVVAVVDKLREIEKVFSLYRQDSSISTLNREGVLHHPPPMMIDLLNKAKMLHEITDGNFDPTIQPFWDSLAWGADTGIAKSLIGFDRVFFDSDIVRFKHQGMKISLNGIVQGYATDIIATMIKQMDYPQSLINIGEFTAMGDWRVGIENNEQQSLGSLTLSDEATATSAPYALMLGENSHILPVNENHSVQWNTVTVVAANATLADGLSTGVVYLPLTKIRGLLNFSDINRIVLEDRNHKVIHLASGRA